MMSAWLLFFSRIEKAWVIQMPIPDPVSVRTGQYSVTSPMMLRIGRCRRRTLSRLLSNPPIPTVLGRDDQTDTVRTYPLEQTRRK